MDQKIIRKFYFIFFFQTIVHFFLKNLPNFRKTVCNKLSSISKSKRLFFILLVKFLKILQSTVIVGCYATGVNYKDFFNNYFSNNNKNCQKPDLKLNYQLINNLLINFMILFMIYFNNINNELLKLICKFYNFCFS